MKTNSKLMILLSLLCVLVFFTKPAHAYIDPGTGSMLLQVLLGVAAIVIGIVWHRLKLLFSRVSRFFGKKKNQAKE